MRAAVPIILIAVALALVGRPEVAIVAVIVLSVGWVAFRARKLRLQLKAVIQAKRAFDPQRLHAAVDVLLAQRDLKPAFRSELLFEKGIAYLMEENYAEGRAVLSQVNAAHLDTRNRLALRGNLAWCDAHLGRTDEAIREANACVELASSAHPELVGVYLGTVGVAQLKAGRAQEAVKSLERALQSPAPFRQLQALHAEALGCAYEALGQSEDARRAFDQAHAAAPDTRSGQRAAARLKKA